jgi:hypothetical protein
VFWCLVVDNDGSIGAMSAPYHTIPCHAMPGGAVRWLRTPDPCASSGGGEAEFLELVDLRTHIPQLYAAQTVNGEGIHTVYLYFVAVGWLIIGTHPFREEDEITCLSNSLRTNINIGVQCSIFLSL